MRDHRRTQRRPTRQLVLTALLAALAVGGCQSSTASPSPSAVASATTPSITAAPATAPPPSPTAAPTAAAWGWTDAGTMSISRDSPHAVGLGDGRVLVVGTGGDPSDDSVRTDIWGPGTAEWHETEPLNKPRALFIAEPLPDRGVLVAGGQNAEFQSFSSAYTYDPSPAAESWTKVGLMVAARTAPASAVLPDGRILVAGGYFHFDLGGVEAAPGISLAAYRDQPPSAAPRADDADPGPIGRGLATAEIFDPTSGTWSSTGSLKYARYAAVAVALADGRILVAGSGSSRNGVAVDDAAASNAEIYDPATGKFHLTDPLPGIDRKALEAQGAPHANKVPEYDPELSDVGSLVALDDGGAVLIGQTGYWSHEGDITRSFRFDAASETWSEIGQTYVLVGEPTPVVLETPGVRRLTGAMAATLPDGRVMVAGGAGADAGGTSDIVEAYDPVTDTWSPLPSMPDARAGGAVVTLEDGSILLVGGRSETAEGLTPYASAIRYGP